MSLERTISQVWQLSSDVSPEPRAHDQPCGGGLGPDRPMGSCFLGFLVSGFGLQVGPSRSVFELLLPLALWLWLLVYALEGTRTPSRRSIQIIFQPPRRLLTTAAEQEFSCVWFMLEFLS